MGVLWSILNVLVSIHLDSSTLILLLDKPVSFSMLGLRHVFLYWKLVKISIFFLPTVLLSRSFPHFHFVYLLWRLKGKIAPLSQLFSTIVLYQNYEPKVRKKTQKLNREDPHSFPQLSFQRTNSPLSTFILIEIKLFESPCVQKCRKSIVTSLN